MEIFGKYNKEVNVFYHFQKMNYTNLTLNYEKVKNNCWDTEGYCVPIANPKKTQ